VIQPNLVASFIRILKLLTLDFQCSQGGVSALPHKQLPAGKRVDLKSKEMLFVSKLLEALPGLSGILLHSLGITILMQIEERAHTLCGTTVN
jgi:hypothetical protein